MRLVNVLAASLLSASAMSCAPSPGLPGEGAQREATVSGIFFPVMAEAGDGAARPAGLLTGTLRLRDGCLWIEREAQGTAEAFLPLWPAGSRAGQTPDGIAVFGGPGRKQIAREGTRVRAGGGETRDLEFVRELIGETPPPECQTGEAYWRAYEISTED